MGSTDAAESSRSLNASAASQRMGSARTGGLGARHDRDDAAVEGNSSQAWCAFGCGLEHGADRRGGMAVLGAPCKFGMGFLHVENKTSQCVATSARADKQPFG